MEQSSQKFQEKDLYLPLDQYFTNLGYKVNGEINSCDLVAEKEGHLIIVEIKLALNLELILQGAQRQTIADQVYIAYLKPKKFKQTQRFKRILSLLRRLEMGLILVNPESKQKMIEIALDAKPYDREVSRARYKRKKEQVIHELYKRQTKTLGGVTGVKIMTAYREDAIKIATYLSESGPQSLKQLDQYFEGLLEGKRIRSILTNNYYGWFVRVKKGIYNLSENWSAIDSSL